MAPLVTAAKSAKKIPGIEWLALIPGVSKSISQKGRKDPSSTKPKNGETSGKSYCCLNVRIYLLSVVIILCILIRGVISILHCRASKRDLSFNYVRISTRRKRTTIADYRHPEAYGEWTGI